MLVGILAVLVILVASGAAIYLAVSRSPSITVPTPPGWEPANEKVTAQFEDAADQSDQEVTIDYLFTDGTLTNSIAVCHGNVYIMDSPDGEDLESIENFFNQHKQELVTELEAAYMGSGINLKLGDYAVEEMACGIPALFMSMTISGQGLNISQDYLFFFKDDTAFFSIITKQGGKGNREEADFLKENISFE